MNAALLRSASPVSELRSRHGLRGSVVSSSAVTSAALRCGASRFSTLSKGDAAVEPRSRGVRVANSSTPWLLPPSRMSNRVAERHWELLVTMNWRDVDIAELRALVTGTKQNCDHLRSVSPVSELRPRRGLRGFVVSSTGAALRCGASRLSSMSKGDIAVEPRSRGFRVANSSAPWLPPSRVSNRPGAVAVRHWDLLVTTNWRDVDIAELRALLTGTKQNCDQFPKLNPDGSIPEVSPVKLKRAIQHSFIVVAMYIRGELPEDYFPDRPEDDAPPRSKRTLVAFARATSDRALTASVHDVAVAPSLQGRGIGRRLMQRMVREICRYGISDISVMANRQTRPFFRACGFGSDVLGSTAMMYTASSDAESSMLLIPPAVQEARRKEVVNSVSSA